MKTSDFFYELPKELIANNPAKVRDQSRLLALDRITGEIEHKRFYDIVDYLEPGDLLVLNDSKVIPARLIGKKVPSGGKIEFLLLEQKAAKQWEILVKPGKKALPRTSFLFGDGRLKATILAVLPGGNRLAEFEYDGDFYAILDQVGEIPLPHYIENPQFDKGRYQTIYAKENGSAAAPTAGLHFTKELFAKLAAKGVNRAYVTLHIGLGTFRPVKVENITEHQMHAEHYFIPAETAELINKTKANGKRVVCVGTTSCRTLEAAYRDFGCIKKTEASTDIFMYPGYAFKVADAHITNFHLPESTLIMLVSAFAGKDNIFKAYEEAIREGYHFYSFGDAMLIKCDEK